MALLGHVLSAGLVLCLLGEADVSVQVDQADPSIHPINTLATGLVVVEVDIARVTGKVQTQLLHGEPPFLAAALDALEKWRFVVPREADIATTSVTFLFRPATVWSGTIGATALRPWNLDEDFPALPQEIIDPGYPATCLATGAAILEVRVNASGIVTSTRPVAGVRRLTDQAQEAVKNWRFSPARTSGKAAPSTVFVVISFVLPT